MTHLFNATLNHPMTRRTFSTLTKHHTAEPGAFDDELALKLLRNNVRDVSRSTTYATRQSVAQRLLTHWRNGLNETTAQRSN